MMDWISDNCTSLYLISIVPAAMVGVAMLLLIERDFIRSPFQGIAKNTVEKRRSRRFNVFFYIFFFLALLTLFLVPTNTRYPQVSIINFLYEVCVDRG